MNEALLLWVAGIGVLATLVLSAVVALRRSRHEAERRRQAEATALELAQRESARAAAERAAARQASVEAEARRHAEVAARLEAEQRAAAEAAERTAIAEARAAVEIAYREGERLAAERAAVARAALAPVPAPPAAAPPRPRVPEDTLVMVADDSKVVRVKTSRLLARHRYRVVLAEDGQQAAQLIEQEVPLVLITDVEMPHMDGFELTRYVRQHPLARHIPIIMITSADDRLKAAAIEAGVTLVLGKPYEEATLLACIAQAMVDQTGAA